jgi:ATP-dependent protease HslVU (ClpYQ) ATPase subunit
LAACASRPCSSGNGVCIVLNHGWQDVDTIIKDLVDVAINLQRTKMKEQLRAEVSAAVENRILDILAGDSAQPSTRDSFRTMLKEVCSPLQTHMNCDTKSSIIHHQKTTTATAKNKLGQKPYFFQSRAAESAFTQLSQPHTMNHAHIRLSPCHETSTACRGKTILPLKTRNHSDSWRCGEFHGSCASRDHII